jgi:hypothetical protein
MRPKSCPWVETDFFSVIHMLQRRKNIHMVKNSHSSIIYFLNGELSLGLCFNWCTQSFYCKSSVLKGFTTQRSHRMYLKINQPNNIFLHSTKSLADKLLSRLSFRCTRRIRGGLHTIKKDYSTCSTACTAQHLDQLEHLLFLHSNQYSLHCRHLKIKYSLIRRDSRDSQKTESKTTKLTHRSNFSTKWT